MLFACANEELAVCVGRRTALARSGRCYPGAGAEGGAVRSVTEALECYEAEAVRRSTAKVEQSRAATALLHSEAALAPGDLTRAGTARGASVVEGGGGDGVARA